MMSRLIGASQQCVSISDPSGAGECRRNAKHLAEAHGFDEASVGRISIIATEVATNILQHAGTGCALIQILDDGSRPDFEILGIDQGPGMIDLDQCMRDGFSTAGTAGTGLGAVSRLSTTFDLFSGPGKGTVILSRVAGRGRVPAGGQAAPPAFELGAVCRAVAGEIECGDTWRVADDAATVSIFVADGLGHGPSAAAAANAAAMAFASSPFEAPGSAMAKLHGALSGTRGAAAACAHLHVADGKIDFAGVGNICGAVVTSERSRGMVSHNGILGAQLLRVQQFEYAWPIGGHVVLHSDGLSARWNLNDYPGLMRCHPAIIAAVLFRDFGRKRDDATVVVVSHRR